MSPFLTSSQQESAEDLSGDDAVQLRLPKRHNGGHHLHTLLVAWSVMLHRINNGNETQFSWGLQNTSGTFTVLEQDTGSICNDVSATVADVTNHILTTLTTRIPHEDVLNGFSVILNDEVTPDSSLEINPGSAPTWGNVQLQLTYEAGSYSIKPQWREPLGAQFLANHYARSLRELASQIATEPSTPIRSFLELSSLDRSVLWRWNRDLPRATHRCLQDLIAEQARRIPMAPAVCSWDGEFTYEQVDQHSVHLAQFLVHQGLTPGQIVPLCFEKSKWTMVAVLAVMKAGGAFVLMDPSQPIQRRQVIAEEVGATFVITSPTQVASGEVVAAEAQVLILDEILLASFDESTLADVSLPTVDPESYLYIIFTSGSTGKPKGVIINHATYTTSALARSTPIGYTDKSRVLDFTSYAFDVSVDSMLCTLLRGGCLCIPTDEERMNDLSGAIRRFKINMANMTPSVARILDHDIIPSLYSLGIGGETCSVGDIAAWGKHTRIVVGYGPAECTIGCTVNPSAAGRPYVSIGPGTGAVIWLVDPEDHNKLAPVGAVGELLIEGPIVGQGYLHDPEKTAAAFIEDPTWLLEGGGGVPGRNGRLYKTGDLVRHDPDGDRGFVFVGRKDSQVKLRGQRVELGEIEHHVRNLLPKGTEVAAEIITPPNQAKNDMLVAFIADTEDQDTVEDDGANRISPRLQNVIHSINDELAKVVPVYMIPAVYLGVSQIPRLVSGKIDRKMLRALGSKASLQIQSSNDDLDTADNEPKSEAETSLCAIWCRLLNLPEDQVGRRANFFVLGGDSILAMKMVAFVRDGGFVLTVADVFSYPTLCEMAARLRSQSSIISETQNVPPFSLLKPESSVKAMRSEAAALCGVDMTSIEDIYPCAPMQEIHMAFYTRSKENFVAQRVAEIPNRESVKRLKAAWDQVYHETAILRTRIVQFKEEGFMQVVIHDLPRWEQSSDTLKDFLQKDMKEPMSVNTRLSRYAIVHDTTLNKYFFVWTTHHAIYDAWSTDLIIERARLAYKHRTVTRSVEFKHFIRYLSDPARKDSETYWTTQLDGATGPQFPPLPSRSFIPNPNAQIERFIPIASLKGSDTTAATLIRGAWALVTSQYTMSDDVVFGETFTGRALPLSGIEDIEGPLLATLPVRIRIDRTASVQEFLQSIQDNGTARAAHEHFGIQNIRRLSDDARIACEVKMGLVIQPPVEAAAECTHDDLPMFQAEDAAQQALHFNTYPVMLACTLHQDGLQVLAGFDSTVISEKQMHRVLAQLECVASQLGARRQLPLNNALCLSEEDQRDIWKVNKNGPRSLLTISRTLTIGDEYPTSPYVPWIVNPSNHSQLTPIGAIGELLIEGLDDPESIESPVWLQSGIDGMQGRQSRLYPTGDLVKYADDLSLVFVGHKDSLMQVDGRAIDLETVDLQVQKLLPSGIRAFTKMIRPRDASTPTGVLVTFIREGVTENENMMDLGLEVGNHHGVPIASSISVKLAKILAGFQKALSEVLPPYMIPSVCIPLADEQKNSRAICPNIGEHVTTELISQIRRAFTGLRSRILGLEQMSSAERTLAAIWGRYLGVSESNLAVDDNFFQLGGDSIMAMRIVSELRSIGYRLNVADMFRNMKLRSMADAMEQIEVVEEQKYTPFSLLPNVDVEGLLTQTVLPQLANSEWTVQDVLPVTEAQARDVKATISQRRSAVQYNMLYLEKGVDLQRLAAALEDLVEVHPILRTVFVKHQEEMLQVVLHDADLHKVELATDQPVDIFCKDAAVRDIEVDTLFTYGAAYLKLFVVRGKDENAIMIRISHAQYDGVSFPELLRQLELRYQGIDIEESVSFAEFLQYQSDKKAENTKYWRDVLDGSTLAHISPPPESTTLNTAFITKPIDVTARPTDITLATLLTAGWAKVLAQHLKVSDVTFAGIVSGRTVDLAGADRIMGPCYGYMPVRVRFDPCWSAQQLLTHVRDVYLQGSQHATLGFDEMMRECNLKWSPAEAASSFYPSFINHLDIEYFDSIPFANTTCRVDYVNPHTEPPTPPRVVSFVEKGQTLIGIEADEERREFWDDLLCKLKKTMEDFVEKPQGLALSG